MNSKRLPSLTALRVFAAAGRLESFSNAAVELHVTQGAISRQIRLLEEELEVQLFTRGTRRVELTAAGTEYLAEIQLAFQRIEQATAALHTRDGHTILTVSVLPSVGSLWLMRRLNQFSHLHPNVETRIISSIEPIDLQSDKADVAIRVGALPGHTSPAGAPRVDLVMTDNWQDIEPLPLAADILVPVVSAKLFADRHLTTPSELLSLPRIHTASRPHAWPDWAHWQGLDPALTHGGEEYGHFFMSMEAARQGLGAALIPDILLDNRDDKALVPLRALSVRSAADYYALSSSKNAKQIAIQTFLEWLQAEFTKFNETAPRSSPHSVMSLQTTSQA